MDNITQQQQQINDFTIIASNSDKNQKLTFERRHKKMQGLISLLDPINKQINELLSQKLPIEEEVEDLKNKLHMDCVHPLEFLSHKGSHIICKFCNTKLVVNRK